MSEQNLQHQTLYGSVRIDASASERSNGSFLFAQRVQTKEHPAFRIEPCYLSAACQEAMLASASTRASAPQRSCFGCGFDRHGPRHAAPCPAPARNGARACLVAPARVMDGARPLVPETVRPTVRLDAPVADQGLQAPGQHLDQVGVCPLGGGWYWLA